MACAPRTPRPVNVRAQPFAANEPTGLKNIQNKKKTGAKKPLLFFFFCTWFLYMLGLCVFVGLAYSRVVCFFFADSKLVGKTSPDLRSVSYFFGILRRSRCGFGFQEKSFCHICASLTKRSRKKAIYAENVKLLPFPTAFFFQLLSRLGFINMSVRSQAHSPTLRHGFKV